MRMIEKRLDQMLNRVCYTIPSRVSRDSFLAGDPHMKDVDMFICYYTYNSKCACSCCLGKKSCLNHFLNVPRKEAEIFFAYRRTQRSAAN